MTELPEQRRSRTTGWCRRTAWFAVVLLAVVWVGHHYGLVETQGYLWVLALVPLLAALALVFGAFGFSRIWTYGDLGGRDLTAGLLMALLVLSPYGVAAYLMLVDPPLRDVSTDLDTPPALPTATSRTARMNDLIPQSPGEQRLQVENYPLVTGRRYQSSMDETIAAVEAVLARKGWQVAGSPDPQDVAAGEVTIGALAHSLVLDLPVDVAIRVTADEDSTLVDMRSASRYGRHDLGDNARRIASFLGDLDVEIAGQAGAAAQ